MTRRISNIPAIPDPRDTGDWREVGQRLKEAVEITLGRRGNRRQRAVTVQDLVDWGIISEQQADRQS